MSRQLAIVGFGKMGRLVEQLAPEYGFEVALRLGRQNNLNGVGITREALAGVDAAIEFSAPAVALTHVRLLAQLGVPTVTGTTGWFGQLPEVAGIVRAAGGVLVWGPNFSVGVAVFRKALATAAELLADEAAYGAWAWEIHHDAKHDKPSGTMLQLVETMREAGYKRAIDVSVNRAGKHPGTHEIGFDSAADTITLRHAARSREGFARGALKAAQWMDGRAGVYTFDDVLFGPR